MLVILLGGTLASFLMCFADRFGVKTMHGRSQCDNCGKPLEVASLIPFVGAFIGCKTCKIRGSGSYIAIEAGFALVFSLMIYTIVGFMGITMNAAVWALVGSTILSLFMLLALIDARHYVFPNVLLAWLYAVVLITIILVFILINPQAAPFLIFIKYILGSGLLWAMPLVLISIGSRERWMGYGDGILMGAMGMLVFPLLSFANFCKNCVPKFFFEQSLFFLMMTLFGASIIGLLWAFVENYRTHKTFKLKRGQVIPFGPSLIIAFVGVVIVGILG